MLIGLDFDGIFNNIEKFQLEKIVEEKTWFESKGYKVVNPNGFDIYDIFGLDPNNETDHKLRREFWKKYIFELARKAPLRNGIKEFIEMARKDGDRFVIVTQRYATDKKNAWGKLHRELFFEYIKHNGLDFKKEDIIFEPEDKKEDLLAGKEPNKVKICRDKKISAFVDDKSDNILAISKVIPVIALSAGYNQGVEGENIHRVDVPQEMYKALQTIKADRAQKKAEAKIKRPDMFKPTTGYASIDQVYKQYYTEEEDTVVVPPLKMIDFLKQCAIENDFLDQVIAEYYGVELTAKEFFEKVTETAIAFKHSGVVQGDRVIVALPNTLEALLSLYALNQIGAVPIMANPNSSAEELLSYLSIENPAPKTCIIFNRSYPTLEKVLSDSKLGDVNVITVGVDSSMQGITKKGYKLTQGKNDPKIEETNSVKSWNNFIKENSKESHRYYGVDSEFVPNDCALIIMTGGSTGKEKFAQISNENANAIALQFATLIQNSGKGDNTLNAMPFFHVFGLIQIFHFAATTGKKNIIIPNPKMTAKQSRKLMKKYYPIVNNNAVPTFAMKKVIEPLENTKSVKYLDGTKNMILGGASISASDKARAKEAFMQAGADEDLNVDIGFGITEGTGGVAYTVIGAERENCIGIPTPGTLMKIVNPETGEECKYGVEGEICFAGPTVMMGYLDNPEETAKALRVDENGVLWMHTGDLGTSNPDGSFNFSTRLKRIVVVGGENVYPNRIEDLIKENHPAVSECCVIPMSDSSRGEVPLAKVKLEDGITPTPELAKEILDLCKAKFTKKQYWPVQIDFISEVPMTKKSTPDYQKVSDESLIIHMDKTEKMSKAELLRVKYANNKFYKNTRAAYSAYSKLTQNTTIIGNENLPKSGAAIITMNHLHKNDQNTLLVETDRIVSFLAKKEYFDLPLIGYFYKKLEMIEVDRFGDSIYAMGYAISLIESIPLEAFEKMQPFIKEIIAYIECLPVKEYNKPKLVSEAVVTYILGKKQNATPEEVVLLEKAEEKIINMPISGKENGYGKAMAATNVAESRLKAGRMLGIFPEGTRNVNFYETGQLLPFSTSALHLSKNTNAPIIPTAMTGDHKIGGDLLFRIGEPIRIDSDLTDEEIKEATIHFRNELYRLVALNLVEQNLEKNTNALIKIIDNLQSGIESNELDTLGQIYNALSNTDSERNNKILRLFK